MKYNKLIAAVVGLIMIILSDVYNVHFEWAPEQVTHALLSFLTALGVWGIPNVDKSRSVNSGRSEGHPPDPWGR